MTDSDTDWDGTIFGFDLSEIDGHTSVRFSHTGWHDRNDHFCTASYCWAMLLKGLQDYIEKGIVIPFD